MTLVLGVLTNVKSYLIADKMLSIDGTKENPATLKTEINGMTINITSPNIRITGDKKIYKISDNVFVAGTGDLNKIKEYIQKIKNETIDTIIMKTQDYYSFEKENAPEGLLVMLKNTNISIHAFSYDLPETKNKEAFSFFDWKFILNENSMSIISAGSGSELFKVMYKHIKNECLDKYREALANNQYKKWEAWFFDKIKQVYIDISKYDNAVSDVFDMWK